MAHALSAILLAGRIRLSPLSEALNVPAICLPVGRRGSLLDAWFNVLDGNESLRNIQVVVNTVEEARAVESVARTVSVADRRRLAPHVIAEPAAWRGAAGIARDVSGLLGDDDAVLICEAKLLPPHSIDPLLQAFYEADDVAGVVGVCGSDQPAGIYIFRRSAIELIPPIGYFDLKEQFLPALCRAGKRVVTACLGESVWRLHDLESYLACMRQSLNGAVAKTGRTRVAKRSSISSSAVLDGYCIVEAGAVIEDGAVLHDSVVLWGATVGGGSVISRSIVGSLAVVKPRSRIICSIIGKPTERAPIDSVNRIWHYQTARLS